MSHPADAERALEDSDVQLLAWAVVNCHMLARRALARTASAYDREKWEHVLRICEKAGARSRGVLRASVPTELTEGQPADAAPQPDYWQKIGDLFQSGGMYDPAFLFGMIEAQQAELERLRSLAVPQDIAALLRSYEEWEQDDMPQEVTDGLVRRMAKALRASLAVPATEPPKDDEWAHSSCDSFTSGHLSGEDFCRRCGWSKGWHKQKADLARALRAGAGDRQPAPEAET